MKILKACLILFTLFFSLSAAFCQNAKQAQFSGQFYPADKAGLDNLLDELFKKANPAPLPGEVFALIAPHAGYGYSGQTAAFAYKLIQGKDYRTVVILGSSHRNIYSGIALYAEGAFVTPLGELDVDDSFVKKLLGRNEEVFADTAAFEKEHSVEVQLPFLQKSLGQFKIVPVMFGDCSLDTCRNFAGLLKEAIGQRKDVLVVISSDMYHGYDFNEAESVDELTLSFLKRMDAEGLYYGLREGRLQMCSGFAVVSGLILAKEMGHDRLDVLYHTDSSLVTGIREKGQWTVGYASCAIDRTGVQEMLNTIQKKKLLEIARKSIWVYLTAGEELQLKEGDVVLNSELGAFVTLHKGGQLRGCIGNIVGSGPLYITVRDMAVEAAVRDPRFSPVDVEELPELDIEISVLSPLEKVASADEIELGRDGVMVRRGFNSGVFLPQVATETGWSKEEFLDNLCAHKAGLEPGAWRDKATQLYRFGAEVFSESQMGLTK